MTQVTSGSIYLFVNGSSYLVPSFDASTVLVKKNLVNVAHAKNFKICFRRLQYDVFHFNKWIHINEPAHEIMVLTT